MTAGVALRVEEISKRYPGVLALDRVSFDVGRGQVHALVGGNGSGKSTLVKVLAGVLAADSGRLVVGEEGFDAAHHTPAEARRAGLRFVHQQPSTFDDLTVAENLAIGNGFESGGVGRIHWRAQRARAKQLLGRFGIAARPGDLLSSLSPARRTTIAIARALQDQDDASSGILVLDEPTASLPASEVDALLKTLVGYAREGQTILYISHRLEEILNVSDTVTVLRDGCCVTTKPTSSFTHDSLVEAIVGHALERRQAHRGQQQVGAPVLTIRDLAGGPLKDVNLELRRGEIVGIAGLLGSGRSSMLRMIFGAQAHQSGEIVLEGQVRTLRTVREGMKAGIAFAPEDRAKEAMYSDLSIRENLTICSLAKFSHMTRLSRREEQRAAGHAIGRFGVKAPSTETQLTALSGGNQQKVMLARWIDLDPVVLLLDEPTQGVDVGARSEIHDLIRGAAGRGAGILVASSDFEELASLCDRVVLLREGRTIGELVQPGIRADHLNHALLGVQEIAA